MKEKILVVDDEENYINLVSMILGVDYKIISAADGKEALTKMLLNRW